MIDTWSDLINGERWRSSRTLWVEDNTEHSWEQVGKLASAIEEAIRDHSAVRVVRIRSGSKLGCFAGQLAARSRASSSRCSPAPPGRSGSSDTSHKHVQPEL